MRREHLLQELTKKCFSLVSDRGVGHASATMMLCEKCSLNAFKSLD